LFERSTVVIKSVLRKPSIILLGPSAVTEMLLISFNIYDSCGTFTGTTGTLLKVFVITGPWVMLT